LNPGGSLSQSQKHLSVVFTGALAVDLDERQYELGFGPCLDAAKTGQTIIVDSQEDDGPYREFARVAGGAGVRHGSTYRHMPEQSGTKQERRIHIPTLL
jgi:hypothetical protein